jgi:cardiolipin synthase
LDGRLTLPGAAQGEEHLDRILTAPNVVTMVRLLCLPIYLYILFGLHSIEWAAVVLGLLGITDFVDGQLARRLGQVSSLGKVLDPVVDRLLMLTAVITVPWVGAAPWWFAGLTLARELAISLATLLLASLGAKRIDVLFIGKAGAFGLMVAYPALLLGHGSAPWQEWFRVLGWVSGVVGLVLAWAALFSYVRPAREALKAGRTARFQA